MSMIAGTVHLDVIALDGELITIFLIIIVSISFLLSGTKYTDKYDHILGTCSNPLLIVFIAIVISKIIVILKLY